MVVVTVFGWQAAVVIVSAPCACTASSALQTAVRLSPQVARSPFQVILKDLPKTMRYPVALLLLLLASCIAGPLHAAEEQHWIPSWYGTSLAPTHEPERLPCLAKQASDPKLSAEDSGALRFENVTFRTIVHLTIGGDRLRLRLSNADGCSSLRIGRIDVRTRKGDRTVTFNGQAQTTVSAGMAVVSDPLNVGTTDGENIEIRAFYPGLLPHEMTFTSGAEENTIIPDASLSATRAQQLSKRLATYFLTAVDVDRASSRGVIVAIGDSITAGGAGAWPALLARRLQREGKEYSVLNAGIGGNRLLSDSPQGKFMGESVPHRFQHDVLDQQNVSYVILYIGINDLGLAQTTWDNSPTPKVAEFIRAICHLSERAHQRGSPLYVSTLPPFEGTSTPGYYTDEKNKVRQQINAWVRESRCIDGYFDFDRALAHPEELNRLHPEFDSGDHLHPNEAGQRALSSAIDLSFFE